MPEQHGRDKAVEPDDPHELIGSSAPGSPETMARCLVEEYLRIGKRPEALMDLFQNPFYGSAHALYQQLGEERIKTLIDRVVEDTHYVDYEVEVVRHGSGDGDQKGAGSDGEGS